MSLSNLQVFNAFAYTTMMEALSYNINLFNEATRGGLVLRDGNNQGDYTEQAMYRRISGLVRRRNAYGSGAVAAIDLSHFLENSVKFAGGTPPVNIDPHWWQWIQRSPEEAGAALGKQLAEDRLADTLSVSIKAFVAAIVNEASNVYDGTAGNASLGFLNSTAAKFGDRNGDIVCWVMHSKPLFDIYGAAIANANQLFTFGTVKVVQDGMGRPFVVTDSADLSYVATGTKYRTLGLVPGAVVIENNPDFLDNVETNNGDESIKRTYQAQWSQNIAVKGFVWDKTNGGHSPTNAALSTGTNWDKVATSVKDLAGVLGNSQ